MSSYRSRCSRTAKRVGLALALAAWGAQAAAADEEMHQSHGMQPMSGGMAGHADHAAHEAMAHGDMSAPMSDMHAHHHQMMMRQGFDRSVHEYVAPDLTLVDMDGNTTTLRQILDTREPVLMNFIFTTCTTICPVLSATFSQVQQELGDEARQVRMISITIDPEQDTPQQLKQYAERYQAGPQWTFLTGELANVVAVQTAFDIYRGSKVNHEPITLLRGAGATAWVRIDGIASAQDIIGEYRKLAANDQ